MKIEEGIVVNVYEDRGTVRVKRIENDGVISAELKVIFRGTLKNKEYSMPAIGEQVVCIFSDCSKGFVLGAVYNDEDQPPVKDKKKHYLQFEDGAVFEYDTSAHVLKIKSENVIVEGNIQCTGTITSG